MFFHSLNSPYSLYIVFHSLINSYPFTPLHPLSSFLFLHFSPHLPVAFSVFFYSSYKKKIFLAVLPPCASGLLTGNWAVIVYIYIYEVWQRFGWVHPILVYYYIPPFWLGERWRTNLPFFLHSGKLLPFCLPTNLSLHYLASGYC